MGAFVGLDLAFGLAMARMGFGGNDFCSDLSICRHWCFSLDAEVVRCYADASSSGADEPFGGLCSTKALLSGPLGGSVPEDRLAIRVSRSNRPKSVWASATLPDLSSVWSAT